jgi:DNA-binding response OmpR family regulator
MESVHRDGKARVLIFEQNESMGKVFREVCAIEEVESVTMTTADQALDFLASPQAVRQENNNGQSPWVVLLDNLQVSFEGQAFISTLRDRPYVRARIKTVCVAVAVNCEWARTGYGDVLDDYLVMPLHLKDLLAVIGVELSA